jgi:hypothetical protein
MISSKIPVNIYTDTPKQHSNVFLGSLHLLFWLIFHPSAWGNHIYQIDISLEKNFSLIEVLTYQRRQNKRISQFIFQVFILLPILTNLISATFFLILGTPWNSVVFGMLAGLCVGFFGGIVTGIVAGVAVGVVFNVLVGLAFSIVFGMAGSLAIGASLGMVLGVACAVAFEVAGGKRGGVDIGVSIFMSVIVVSSIQFDLIGGLAGGLTFMMGLWINWWRPVIMSTLFIPWHTLIYRIDKFQVRSSYSLLSKHLAFWDEWQYLPIWGLDKHLLMIIDRNPIEGHAALNYLSTSRQRWAAQSVKIELDIRQLEHCYDVFAISKIQQILVIRELDTPQIEDFDGFPLGDFFDINQIQQILTVDSIFQSFNSISIDVNIALGQSSIYNQRLALTAASDRLNDFVRELAKSSGLYAIRFQPIAKHWQDIVNLYLQDLIEESVQLQEIDSPYIIGIPITNQQKIFAGRTDISKRLERLVLDRQSPPLLLYGQRRIGKTSLLNNLGKLLPTNIIPLFIDLQGSVSSAKDHAGFIYNLARGMINSAKRQRNITLPSLAYKTIVNDPFTHFDEWLDSLEKVLGNDVILLALDEFEVLDRVLNEGRFNENDVLGMLRNLIQHRPRFKVLLAGYHTLDEFQRWSSYLINAQVIHLGYLQESEARQLIEEPIENFALRYQPPASQRVLDITKGHPFLVQLLCAEIVALKNDQDPSIRRLATLADVEAAIPAALEHGSMFFSDIERNQLDAQSLKVLRYFAQQGEGAIISSADLAAHFTGGAKIAESISGSIELLLRRELIETKPSGYSIQLELIRRWFI